MSCFVYGTLQYPEVLRALIDRVPRMEPAVIHGYQRHRIRNQVFPGIIKSVASARVQGLVLFDLQPDELEVLDEFEGDEYYKQPVQAQLGAGGAVETVVYVWQDALRGYMYGEWDPEAFRQEELPRYVEMCRGFAADVKAARGWKGNFPTSSDEEAGGAAAAEARQQP